VRITVTGSTGKIGRRLVEQLTEAGHDVTPFDISVGRGTIRIDCTDTGQVLEGLQGIDVRGGTPDAVVHLAGIPAPGMFSDSTTFSTNTLSTYNVMSACARLGIPRLVWASSETILGLPFSTDPEFVPIDETHPDRPEWHYSLSKQVGETIAEAMTRWHPQLSIVSLRISNVFDADDYAALPEIQANPAARKMNLWAYVDADDAALACRLACEAQLAGHQRLIIAAADTIMDTPTKDLIAQFYPNVPLTHDVNGNDSLLNCGRACDAIGYRPAVSWRDRRQPTPPLR
jgi:nucleoside-diphosphate-sugar epimerase